MDFDSLICTCDHAFPASGSPRSFPSKQQCRTSEWTPTAYRPESKSPCQLSHLTLLRSGAASRLRVTLDVLPKMKPTIVKIPTNEIHDWDSFHKVFARVLGFPDFYGCNMNAWIDCMTSIDEPLDGLSETHGTKEAGICLDLGDCTAFAKRCPQQYEAILDSSAFVNYRRIEAGEEPVISLSFHNQEPISAQEGTSKAKRRWGIRSVGGSKS